MIYTHSDAIPDQVRNDDNQKLLINESLRVVLLK